MPAKDVRVGGGGRTAGRVQGNYAEADGFSRVTVSLSQLAQVYAGQGKYVKAEPVYREALKVYQTAHGEFHADVAATLNNLGGVLHRMYGLYAQAEPLLTRALAIKEKLLGLDHSDVALSVVNLAQLRVVQEQPEKLNRGTVEPWRYKSGRWGRPIQMSRRCWRTLPRPSEIRACRRGGLAGVACQKLSREAELNRSRHTV